MGAPDGEGGVASKDLATSLGDGTTSATVLARAISPRAQRCLPRGTTRCRIKRGIDRAVTAIIRRSE
jgi:chaperonin GroEL